MSMTAKLTRTVPTLTASEFLKHLKDGSLPEKYILPEDIYFPSDCMRVISRAVNFNQGIFKGNVLFGDLIFKLPVFFDYANFEGEVVDFSFSQFESSIMLGKANFEGDMFLSYANFQENILCGDANFNGRIHAGSNPALAWQLSQHQRGTVYSTADARHMCGHPRPMMGWEQDKKGNYVFTG